MDAETVEKECQVIIGFENNFLEKGVAVTPLVPFVRNAKFLSFQGHQITIPQGQVGVVTEVHFGIIIRQDATDISKDNALDYVNGYVVVLSSRLRDDEYKKSEAETFSTITDFKDAIVISNVVSKELLPHPNAATIWASLNGKECQKANITDARLSVQEMIEKGSQLKTLRAGDLILSGSPAGSSFFVKPGDTVEMGILGIIRMEISVQKDGEITETIPLQEPEFPPKKDEFA